jgi:hypothetical protein
MQKQTKSAFCKRKRKGIFHANRKNDFFIFLTGAIPSGISPQQMLFPLKPKAPI